MRVSTKQKIAQQVLDWHHEGLISTELAQLLAARFEASSGLMSILLRWLGFFALLLLGMSVLGLVGMTLGEAALYLAPFVLGALSAAAWYFGAQMASHPKQSYPFSGAVLLTAGLIGIFGALTLFFIAFGGRQYQAVYPLFMLVTAVASLATAYRYALRWPLAFGILLLFHALGNWHTYSGQGTYLLGIRDERVTAIAGLVSVGFGMWQEHHWERDAKCRWVGFGDLYIVFGLLYVNVSVWFLSLFPGGLRWVLVFTLLGVAQLIAGARQWDTRFVGFGIVFLSIDLYTRFFEHFWDSLSKGAFFLLAGLLGVVLGGIMELKSRQSRQGAGA
jgi:hypothetical protein